MNSITLTEEEIKGISSFIEEVKKISAVECLYITGYYDNPSNSIKMEVMTVWNDSLSYKEKIYGDSEVDTREEIEKLREVIQHQKDENNLERVVFNGENSDLYYLSLMHSREILSEISLISGTIIFDRFESFVENQKKASELLHPYPNIIPIDNLSSLTHGNCLKRQLALIIKQLFRK